MFPKLEKCPVAIACSLATIRDPVMVEYFLAFYNTDKKQKKIKTKNCAIIQKEKYMVQAVTTSEITF